MKAKIDVNSDTWKAIERWAREREAQLVSAVVHPACPDQLTQLHRGEILTFRALLDLPDRQ